MAIFTPTATRAVACLLLPSVLRLVAPAAGPSVAPAWTLPTDSPVLWLRVTEPGVLVVSTEAGLLGLDPATGAVKWRRPDLGNVTQDRFEAALQVTPYAAGTVAPGAKAPTIRTMEEIPHTSLAGILSDSAGRRAWFEVIDLGTGATAWDTRTLPVTETRGFLPFPDGASLLVHAVVFEPGQSRRLFLRVETTSGRLLWTTDSLLRQSPVQFDPTALAASRGTINGNQPLVALPDSTAILYASPEGAVRFDIRTGAAVWRGAASTNETAPIGQGYAPLLVRDDIVLVPAGTVLDAIALGDGHRLWTSGRLPAMITQVEVSAAGVLVRGNLVLDPRGQAIMPGRPFLALLDPATGKSRWPRVNKEHAWGTPFLVAGDSLFTAANDGLFLTSQTDGTTRALTTGKFPGRPVHSLESRNGALLVGGAQSLTLVEPDGTLRYQTEYPAPAVGFLGKMLRFALAGVAAAGGAYYSAGALAGSAFIRYHATRQTSDHAYFLIKDVDGHGPGLIKVEKQTGNITVSIPLGGDKTPEYLVSEAAGVLLVLRTDREITAYTW